MSARRITLAVCAVVVVTAGIWLFSGRIPPREIDISNIAGQESAGSLERAEIVARVAKLVELPSDEQPTIATITDPERLRNQPFFAKAKLGDKVLIYPGAQKAILYDPSADAVLEIAPLAGRSENE